MKLQERIPHLHLQIRNCNDYLQESNQIISYIWGYELNQRKERVPMTYNKL